VTTVNELFDEKVRLPSPPAIALKILEAVRQEDNSFDDLAQIIMSDPSLAIRVLTVANSSLYGLSQPVTSLSQATGMIGTDALKNIALSFVIVQEFQNPSQGSFDLEYFWRRAVTTAVAADVLGNAVNHKDQDLFVSGLLQDIGVLILFLSLPEDYTTVLDGKRVSGETLCIAEKEQFSCDHTEIASYLLTAWNLPESIREPIRNSHSPEKAKELHKRSAMILECADKISAIYHGLHSTSKAKDVRSALTKACGLSTEKVDELIDTIGARSREILDLFAIDPGKIKPFSLLMQEANEELGALNLSYEQIVLDLKQAKQNSEQLARELQLANQNLKKLAYRDGLTGLYNKRYFHKVFSTELERSMRYKLPLSLLLLDIDFFKDVNDTYGHPVGDKVLIRVSNILLRLVRNSDVVARYGGEEFAVILPETEVKGAKVLAQRLRRGIAQEQLKNGDHTVSVTVSIGLCGTNLVTKGLLTDTIIECSDKALYKAKQNGRNRVEQFIT
jgi:diguanylate cyclase (GGDEF)-like protein